MSELASAKPTQLQRDFQQISLLQRGMHGNDWWLDQFRIFRYTH